MISFLRGTVTEVNHSYVLIDCNGVGYRCEIGETIAKELQKKLGEQIIIYTNLIIKESEHILYGFLNKSYLEIFKLLLKINGVGAKVALTILDHLSPENLYRAVVDENIKLFTCIPTIGEKKAKNIIHQLKDKVTLNKFFNDLEQNENYQIAMDALEKLGYKKEFIKEHLLKINTEQHKTADEIVSEFLKSTYNEL